MTNQEIVLAFYQAFDQHDEAATRKLLSPNLTAHIGGKLMNLEQWSGMGRMFAEAFPDGRHTWERVVAAGDHVLLNGWYTGTHRAPFMGLPATGRTVKISATMLETVIDGKLVEHRGDFDTGALMQQLTAPEVDPRALIEAFTATVDAQDWDAVMAMVAPTCKVQIGAFRGGRDEWRAMGQAFYAGFPDGKNTIEEIIVAGDRVTMIGTWSGTHRGAFQGIPPTGKKVSFSQTHVYRLAGGLVTEHRGEFDAAGLMQQLTQ